MKRPIEKNNAQFNDNYQFCNKKVIIFEYLKNRKLKINKIFVSHTNLSFSFLDSLASLFPECKFLKTNCRLALQKCWKTASDFPFSLKIKWKTVRSHLKFGKNQEFFQKNLCHQKFTFASKIFNFNKKNKKKIVAI
jgi:hypothetical protein